MKPCKKVDKKFQQFTYLRLLNHKLAQQLLNFKR